MKAMARATALGIGLLALSGIAYACSDPSCDASWKLFANSPDCANRAVLGPGNDSRVNLLLLLRSKAGLGTEGLAQPALDYETGSYGRTFLDWHVLNAGLFPPKPDESDGEGNTYAGSRCVSLPAGTAGFNAALGASKNLPAAERSALSGARQRLAAVCDGSGDAPLAPWPEGIASAPGKAFLGYLKGADAFYGERWDEARQSFAALAQVPDPWVRETAAYMLARVELNAAQAKAFDEYGWYAGLSKTDKAAVGRASAALAAYLKAWPQGRYSASAVGLLRRALWLVGDMPALAKEYARLLAAVPAGSAEASVLVQEIDNKLLFTGDREPAASGQLLLATLDLVRMRDNRYEVGDGSMEGKGPELTEADLAAQAPQFAQDPELFTYLQANHAFYVGKDMRRVLQLVPDDSHRSTYSPLAFSRQVLRGQALGALGDRNEAAFWRDLLGGSKALWQRPTIELGLALNYERKGQLAAVFAKDSPIDDTTIRKVLLAHSAGPALLRGAASDAARPLAERDLALFTLLYKQLTRGDYAGFVANRPLVGARANIDAGMWDLINQDQVPVGLFARGRWSDGYPCRPLTVTAATLARNLQDNPARLCLGDFLRLGGFDDFAMLDTAPPKDELGGFAAEFKGRSIERGAIYAAIIAQPRAAPNDRAYALYRAVRCYAPSGNNSCGGSEVEPRQRKAWYDQLKREYPASTWAKQLRAYW